VFHRVTNHLGRRCWHGIHPSPPHVRDEYTPRIMEHSPSGSRPLRNRLKRAPDGAYGLAAIRKHVGKRPSILGKLDCRLLSHVSQLFCQGDNAPFPRLSVLGTPPNYSNLQVHSIPGQLQQFPATHTAVICCEANGCEMIRCCRQQLKLRWHSPWEAISCRPYYQGLFALLHPY
jgi:hypothetical protein